MISRRMAIAVIATFVVLAFVGAMVVIIGAVEPPAFKLAR